jgi:hypothetical protein
LAFAASDAHAATRGPYRPLSVEHLYYHAVGRTPNGHPKDGVGLPATLLALSADGQCLETGWPYLPMLPADLSAWVPPASATPNHRCQGAIAAGAIDEIVAILKTDCPVVVALLLGTQFYTPVAGVVEPNPGEADTDYHAVLAVGYGDDKAQKFILVRNSWGDAWGIAGCAWLAAEYLKARLYAFARMEKTP